MVRFSNLIIAQFLILSIPFLKIFKLFQKFYKNSLQIYFIVLQCKAKVLYRCFYLVWHFELIYVICCEMNVKSRLKADVMNKFIKGERYGS